MADYVTPTWEREISLLRQRGSELLNMRTQNLQDDMGHNLWKLSVGCFAEVDTVRYFKRGNTSMFLDNADIYVRIRVIISLILEVTFLRKIKSILNKNYYEFKKEYI